MFNKIDKQSIVIVFFVIIVACLSCWSMVKYPQSMTTPSQDFNFEEIDFHVNPVKSSEIRFEI